MLRKSSGPVVLFARNRLCALVRPGLAVTPRTLLDRMLDPQVKLGTSTPKADPSGDYAWEVFRKAERSSPAPTRTLEKKALQLTGGPSSPPAPQGRRSTAGTLREGTRRHLSSPIAPTRWSRSGRIPGSRSCNCPTTLAVGADYGLTVLNGASPPAYDSRCSSCRWKASARWRNTVLPRLLCRNRDSFRPRSNEEISAEGTHPLIFMNIRSSSNRGLNVACRNVIAIGRLNSTR